MYLYYLVGIVKKILLYIVFLSLIGCSPNIFKSKNLASVSCPPVLFAKEHKVYMDSLSGNISLDDIVFKAEINNAVFKKGCKKLNNVFSSDLSLLFIVQPLLQNQGNINLPFYIAILDSNKNLQNIQYYLTKGIFNKDSKTQLVVESEIFTTENINYDLKNNPVTIVVGFMLDEKRLNLLN